MATNDLTAVDAALKENYPIGTFEKQFSDQNEFYDKMNKTEEFQIDATGRRAIIPLVKDLIGGGGFRPVGGALPNAKSFEPKNAQVEIVSLYQRGYLPRQSMLLSQKDAGAFASLLDEVMNQVVVSMMRKKNFNLLREYTALITSVNGPVNNDTAIVLDSVKGIHSGMLLDIYTDGTSTTEATNAEVTQVNESTKTITVSANITVTDEADVYEAGDKGYGFNGLLDNVSTSLTDKHGIDVSSEIWFQGNNVTSSVGEIQMKDTLDLLRTSDKKLNLVNKPGADGRFWLTTLEVADKIYLNLLRPDQRHNDKATISGGRETFKLHGLPVVKDDDMPEGYLILVEPTKWYLFRVQDADWIPNAGYNVHPVAGYDAIEFALAFYGNLFCGYPKSQPFSYGITES